MLLLAVGMSSAPTAADPAATNPAAADPPAARTDVRDSRLAAELLAAVNAQRFAGVLDTVPPTGSAVGAVPIHQTPNVDTVVFELDGAGRPIAAADVLLSPHYPNGKVVPLDANLTTNSVRWRQWDDATWDDNGGQGTVDVLPGLHGRDDHCCKHRNGACEVRSAAAVDGGLHGHETAPIDFMSPYPASVLKLMAAFGVLRLVDAGEITLADRYAYAPVGTPGPLCGGARTATVTRFFDEMITGSSNPSACALIKLLHDHNAIDGLNQEFVDLGLPMLRLVGTNPHTGGTWGNSVVMNSVDTAKLLLLLSGAPGTLWKTPAGAPVDASVLSATSRRYLLGKLADQGLNQVLSTTNWYGRAYPAQGIPQTTPARWINPIDGTVTVEGHVWGQDVRPGNASAQVTFSHKTGLADTSGNDAGIVKALPGEAWRSYLVVVGSNLGYRYVDPNRPADPAGVYPVQYTEKLARLGKAIDTAVISHHNPR